jgi:hypothetical protein
MCAYGSGNDLCIVDQANNNTSSYSNLGSIYELPAGKENTWLAGAYQFKVLEIEVFTVKFV